MIYLLALLIGVVAGLRAMTAPAAVAWAAYLGWLPLEDSWAWFMGHWLTPWIFSVLAICRTGHRPAADHAEPQGAVSSSARGWSAAPVRRDHRRAPAARRSPAWLPASSAR